MGDAKLAINRAPVLTLWAAVVAERLGYDRLASLSLGRALAGLNAQSKGRNLGIFGPPSDRRTDAGAKEAGPAEELWVDLCGRRIPARHTIDGLRAVKGPEPVDPAPVEKYLLKSFGEDYEEARRAMVELAASMEPRILAQEAYGLYERFRPAVPAGRAGWGARGELDLALVRALRPPR